MTKIEKTMMQIDIELYQKLYKMRKFRTDSKVRYEPMRAVIKRLYDFYIEKGGELPHST